MVKSRPILFLHISSFYKITCVVLVMEELKPYAEEMLFDRGVAAADDHPLCTHYGTFRSLFCLPRALYQPSYSRRENLKRRS